MEFVIGQRRYGTNLELAFAEALESNASIFLLPGAIPVWNAPGTPSGLKLLVQFRDPEGKSRVAEHEYGKDLEAALHDFRAITFPEDVSTWRRELTNDVTSWPTCKLLARWEGRGDEWLVLAD